MEFEGSFAIGNILVELLATFIDDEEVPPPPFEDGGVSLVLTTSEIEGSFPQLRQCPVVPLFFIRPTADASLSSLRLFHPSQIEHFSAPICEFVRASLLRVLRTVNPPILLEVCVEIKMNDFGAPIENLIPTLRVSDPPLRYNSYYDVTAGGIYLRRLEDDPDNNLEDEPVNNLLNEDDDLDSSPSFLSLENATDEVLNHGEIYGVPQMLEVQRECCSICMEELLNGTRVRLLPCLHRFHTLCISQWLEQRNSCPLCRYALPGDGTQPLRKIACN